MKITLLVLGAGAILFAAVQARSARRETTAGEYGWAASSVVIAVGPALLGALAILAALTLPPD